MASELKIEHDNNDPPKSPLSQVFLRLYSPLSEQIINCAMCFSNPIDVEALKKEISNSIMIKHPRFCSLMVKDQSGKHWKKTHVNIDDHIIIHQITTSKVDDDEKEVEINSFLAEISVSTPLSEKKPLWEVHVLLGLKSVVLRVHHALGDGASLMSMLSTCFGKKNDEGLKSNYVVNNGDYRMKNHNNTYAKNNKDSNDESKKKGVWGLVKSLWFTLVFMLRVLGRILWVKDKVSVVSGCDGMELWPRKLATAKFLLEDFKSIKMVIPQVTVNDVLLGIISSGLSKYVNLKSSKGNTLISLSSLIRPILNLTRCNKHLNSLLSMLLIYANIHIYSQFEEISDLMSINSNRLSGWGNKTGIVLLPICCRNSLHPLDHVRAMKATMDKKKHSYEAYFVYKTIDFLVYLGSTKVASWCFQKVLTNTTLTISNIKGPLEEIVVADNPVTHMRVNLSSLPQAITIHMVSYAGKADLQVMVAKDVIPDPEILVKCFQDSFLEMKNSIKNIDMV
ncbi:O-acyltransferase WSD1 [Bienertia sinuspersici]